MADKRLNHKSEHPCQQAELSLVKVEDCYDALGETPGFPLLSGSTNFLIATQTLLLALRVPAICISSLTPLIVGLYCEVQR